MPTTDLRRRRLPKPDRRRALHGFTIPQMVELVRAGLATATAARVVAGRRTIEVARLRITEAGRHMLAWHHS
jgi:hypothetical protein